jgi:CubicO group peptidase (beta-lactamase class C family)
MFAHKRHIVACVVVLFIASVPLGAREDIRQHPRVQQAIKVLELWLQAQRDYEEIPGVSASVVHDQEVVWSGGFGFADLERKLPARPDTIYSVCSISKLFTSVAVMQQRDAGKLRLDDPVANHLPWFTIKRADPDAPEITVEGLLTHSSGLPRESDFPYWTGPEFAFPTREQMIDKLGSQETLYPAQTYFQYSNLGMALAGEIVASVSGKPYPAYVRERILVPLKLASTSPDMPRDQRNGRLAVGYSAPHRDGTRQPVTFFSAQGIAPAAGFASTVEDLARFASWQFQVLQRQGGEDVLDANTLREMHRVHWVDPDFETTWGLGFSVIRNQNKTFVGHGGSCPGFRSQLLMKTDELIATVFMANAQGVNTGQFAQRMYEIMAPAIRTAAPKKTAGKPSESDSPQSKPESKEARTKAVQAAKELERYTGTYESGFAGEIAVVVWEDALASFGLPSMNPMEGLAKLERTGEHTFRRVRKDDQSLGETIVFEMGPDGRAERLRWHSNVYRRTR